MIANSYTITNNAIPHDQEQEHIVPHRYALGVCPSLPTPAHTLAPRIDVHQHTPISRQRQQRTPTLVRHEHTWNCNLFITTTSIPHIERILHILAHSHQLILLPSQRLLIHDHHTNRSALLQLPIHTLHVEHLHRETAVRLRLISYG